MTLAEVCDVAYALLVERLERQVLADRQVIASFMAAGAKGLHMPDVNESLAELDAALAAEPDPVVSGREVLEEALGLRRAG